MSPGKSWVIEVKAKQIRSEDVIAVRALCETIRGNNHGRSRQRRSRTGGQELRLLNASAVPPSSSKMKPTPVKTRAEIPLSRSAPAAELEPLLLRYA